MTPLPARADEPTDQAWLAISRMLDDHEGGPELRSEILASHRFSSAGFCTTSVQAFSALHKNGFDSLDSSRGMDFHTFAQNLTASERTRLGLLVARAPAARKASKTGHVLAELARLSGPFGSEINACALDAMALSFSYPASMPFSLEPRGHLIALAARRARDAWPALLASALCRACHESDASLLTELLDGLGPDARCFGVAPLGSTPLGLSIQRASMDLRKRPGPFACAEILLARGADPNGRDAEGMTPLAHAACSKSLPGCLLLLAAGADPWAVACIPPHPLTNSSRISLGQDTCVALMALAHDTRDLSLSLTESRVLGGVSVDTRRSSSPRI